MTAVRQRALECHQCNMIVVPIKADGSKSPTVKWKSIVTQTEADVERLFGDHVQGVGVICGPVSGHLVMLEFEGRAVKARLHVQFRDALIAAGHRDLYTRISQWQERSPSGGLHLHWRCPEAPISNLKLAHDTDRQVLIETRGEGGLTVIAPSHGPTHNSNKPWETTRGGPADCPTITAQEQQIILDLARTYNQIDDTPVVTTTTPIFDDTHQPTALQDLIATYNRSHTWEQVLAGHFTPVGTPTDGVQRWKYNQQTGETGATTNALGTDRLIIFSTTAAGNGWNIYNGNGPAPSYDKFSAHVQITQQGNTIDHRLQAAEALGYKTDVEIERQLEHAAANPPDHPALVDGTNPLATSLILWPTFWQTDHHATQWLIEPLVPAERAVAMYAGAKVGKSYLMLAACAAAATGRPFLNHPTGPPINILYVDFEMTEADLAERLTTFGYGPNDDLSHLHYALLPSLPPLNTRDGGQTLLAAALACQAQLVIIDTTSRSVDGDENDSRTYHDFYNHTGMLLKRHHIAWVRLDHAGKDKTKGQRGSSAKDSDVDIVIRLDKTDSGVSINATHRRIGWYPEHTNITINDTARPATFTLTNNEYSAGTRTMIQLLDQLGAADDLGYDRARRLLLDNNHDAPVRVVKDAVRHRKNYPERKLENVRKQREQVREQSETATREQVREQPTAEPP